jgi:hypothetical protein
MARQKTGAKAAAQAGQTRKQTRKKAAKKPGGAASRPKQAAKSKKKEKVSNEINVTLLASQVTEKEPDAPLDASENPADAGGVADTQESTEDLLAVNNPSKYNPCIPKLAASHRSFMSFQSAEKRAAYQTKLLDVREQCDKIVKDFAESIAMNPAKVEADVYTMTLHKKGSRNVSAQSAWISMRMAELNKGM